MSIKYYDLDKKADKEAYSNAVKETEMKKKNYSAMYKGEKVESPAAEETPITEETKSAETAEEKKDDIYEGNFKVSPNSKGEVVNIDNLRVREKPSTDGIVACLIHKGFVVDVLSKTDGKDPWYEVKFLQNGSEIRGHVMGQYLNVYVEG